MQRARLGFGFELGEDTRSGSRHAPLRSVLPEPSKARCHVGISGGDHRLEIVRSLPRQKGRYFESFPTWCQRRSESFFSGNRDLRREHEVPGRWQIERAQPLADAFAQRVSAVDEKGYVGAELARQGKKIRSGEPKLPKPIQHQQDSRGIRRSAAES